MDYKQGTGKMIQQMASVPDTIEDELPAMSQEFVDKVHAEGGRLTNAGVIVYDEPKATS